MTRFVPVSVGALLGALWCSVAIPIPVAGQSFDFSYGYWWHDATAHLFALTYHTPVIGPLSLGLGGYHLDDNGSAIDRTATGAELSVLLGRSHRGLYGVGSVSAGVRHSDGNVDAAWSAGLGYTLRLFSFLALGIEGRYRAEDTDVNGFWNRSLGDRNGFLLQGKLLIGGGSRTPTASGPTPAPSAPPPADAPSSGGPTGNAERPEESARVAVSVVETALEAMGTPYRWGGSDANGYDCSGLIQWAYGQHGIVLPRTSRDQARTGTAQDRSTAALLPGDILTFSQGGGVSHVGLYVGDGRFIHSSSAGVRLSSLIADDPDSRWWQQRWVGVRRILN